MFHMVWLYVICTLSWIQNKISSINTNSDKLGQCICPLIICRVHLYLYLCSFYILFVESYILAKNQPFCYLPLPNDILFILIWFRGKSHGRSNSNVASWFGSSARHKATLYFNLIRWWLGWMHKKLYISKWTEKISITQEIAYLSHKGRSEIMGDMKYKRVSKEVSCLWKILYFHLLKS